MSNDEKRKELDRRSSFLTDKVELVKNSVLGSFRDVLSLDMIRLRGDRNLPLHMKANEMLENNQENDDDILLIENA